jgi:hypothetical protein
MVARASWKSSVWIQLAVIYTRYLLGGAFVFASLIKIKGHRFTSYSGELAPIHSAAHFFETLYQSGIYWQFLGVGQLVAGFLLMTQRYALLGALLFMPIVANVFVITISYDFGFTFLITGSMLGATLGLLVWDWDRLRVIVNLPAAAAPPNWLLASPSWEIVGAALFAYTFAYRLFVDHYNFLLWFGCCVLIGAGGLLAAWRRSQRLAIR